MSLDHINSKKIRKSFGKIPLVTSLPNLVEVQKRSFDNFCPIFDIAFALHCESQNGLHGSQALLSVEKKMENNKKSNPKNILTLILPLFLFFEPLKFPNIV